MGFEGFGFNLGLRLSHSQAAGEDSALQNMLLTTGELHPGERISPQPQLVESLHGLGLGFTLTNGALLTLVQIKSNGRAGILAEFTALESHNNRI